MFSKYINQLLNYLPGFIILVFSMIALHSSLNLMKGRDTVLNFYKEESRDTLALEVGYHEFEMAAISYINDPSPDNELQFTQRFLDFVDIYFDKIEKLGMSMAEGPEDYKKILVSWWKPNRDKLI